MHHWAGSVTGPLEATGHEGTLKAFNMLPGISLVRSRLELETARSRRVDAKNGTGAGNHIFSPLVKNMILHSH